MELIKPLYFKNKELQGSISDPISDYEISVAASKIISDTEILSSFYDFLTTSKRTFIV